MSPMMFSTKTYNNLKQSALWWVWGVLLLLVSGCLSKKIHYEIPPSPHALTDVSILHVDQFAGQGSLLLKDILIREIYRIPNFDYTEDYPTDINRSAIISGDVQVYSVRDEQELRPESQVTLIQRDVVQRPQQTSARIRKRVFDFAEVPYVERAVHRTLDLKVRFTVTSARTGKILYRNTEKISFQQSYIGEEDILLIPLADDEMERLGNELVKRFLEKLNPSLSKKVLELETGVAPVPMSMGIVDMGHPRILNGNRYAVVQDYDKAIKKWSYVVFAPETYESAEEFIFDGELYAKLKAAKLPDKVINSLLELHGQVLTLTEVDSMLPKLLSHRHFRNYSSIIKAHARASQTRDNLNLAAAHYNLGSVYRLQAVLPLAAYHFAQANAYQPSEKYAQAWTDVQHELGDFNPLDTIIDRTIEAASQQNAPTEAIVKTEKVLADQEQEEQPRRGYPEIQAVELPYILDENQKKFEPLPEQSGESVLDLN